jgi:hypothetical protein
MEAIMTSRRAHVLAAVFCILLPVLPLPAAEPPDNGIAVGRAKVFDNRTLTLLLDSLNDSLSRLQVIDQGQLAKSLALLQGYSSTANATSFSLSTLPLPAVKTTLQANAAGNLVPNQQTSDQAAFTPSAPKLPDALAAPKFEPQFGTSANDLLNDQVNLTYQIFNLRMLLERSLSDRLWQPGNGGQEGARLQAVLGFPISLNPPREARDLAAEVEVTLTPANGTGKFELVALMPQEKTYNTAALSSRSNAFGGSAVVNVLSLGFSAQASSQTLYVYRDTDTVAFQRSGAGENGITFGWQFRPVLGRRSVSPGMRQMFAVIALPAEDQLDSKVPFVVTASITTRWRFFDGKTITTSAAAGRWPPTAWFRKLPPDGQKLSYPVTVVPTAPTQGSLAATVSSVRWIPGDDKTAVVLVTGSNFFPGTEVSIGGTLLTEANGGLALKSDQAMQLKAPLAALARGSGVINGRYGPSAPLQMMDWPRVINGPDSPSTPLRMKAPPPIFICDLNLVPVGDQFFRLTLKIAYDIQCQSPLRLQDLPENDPPILLINGSASLLPFRLSQEGDKNPTVVLKTTIPASPSPKDSIVTVTFPFMGDGWSPSFAIYDPCAVHLTRLGGDKNTILLVSGGPKCGVSKRVLLDQLYEPKNAGDPLRFEVDSATLAKYKKLVVYAVDGAGVAIDTSILDIPPATAPPADPKLDVKEPPQIAQFEGRGVTYTGTNLKTIKSAELNGHVLPVSAKDDKTLTVFLTRAATSKPGLDGILLRTADGTIAEAPVLITPAPGGAGTNK